MNVVNVKVNNNGVISEGTLVKGESELDNLLIYKSNCTDGTTYRYMVAVPRSEGKWCSNLMMNYGSEIVMCDENMEVEWT